MKIYISIPDCYRENCASFWTKSITEQAKDTIQRVLNEEEFDLYFEDGRNKLFPYFEEEDRRAHWVVNNQERYFLQYPEFELLFQWEEADFVRIDEDVDEWEIQEQKKLAGEEYRSQISKAGFQSEADIIIPKDYVYIGSYTPVFNKGIELPGLIIEFDDDGNELISAEMFKNM